MRLNFNIVIVDDDFDDPEGNKCRVINRLIDDMTRHIQKKGFIPEFFKYCDLNSFLNNKSIDGNQHNNRIDFFLSDNNLGKKDDNKNGIDLYLKLKDLKKNKILCDFVLYTRSEVDEIVEKLSNKLNSEKNPNLFTRFTFISRPSVYDTDWHNNIKSLLDHVITQREEINQLRGLFAQITSRMHNKLKEKLEEGDITFSCSINSAYREKYISKDLKDNLHIQRCRRNGIIHNDEFFDSSTNEFKIKCSDKNNSTEKSYSHSQFCELREYLKSTEIELMKQLQDKR